MSDGPPNFVLPSTSSSNQKLKESGSTEPGEGPGAPPGSVLPPMASTKLALRQQGHEIVEAASSKPTIVTPDNIFDAQEDTPLVVDSPDGSMTLGVLARLVGAKLDDADEGWDAGSIARRPGVFEGQKERPEFRGGAAESAIALKRMFPSG